MQMITALFSVFAAFSGIVQGAPFPSNTPAAVDGPRIPSGSVLIAEGVWHRNGTDNGTDLGHELWAHGINDCGASTFENRASAASPLVQDCWRLHDNIAGPGTWTVASGQHQLAQFGTCAFGVHVYAGKAMFAYIGNDDIRDLIRDSIDRFHWDGSGQDKVGARGSMKCQPGWVWVEWGIYHN